jgi:hypothetical protein
MVVLTDTVTKKIVFSKPLPAGGNKVNFNSINSSFTFVIRKAMRRLMSSFTERITAPGWNTVHTWQKM